jgi:tetratricopeptide (TPR) repeat protein
VSPAPELAQEFERATTALGEGRTEEAIQGFEGMADRGLVHPDVSFNRGTAYLKRALTPAEQSGDLGQAMAGFREALSLRPGDETAKAAADVLALEIARRQGERRETQVSVAEPLHVQALSAVDAIYPALAAALGALLVLIGLGLTFKTELRARAHALLVLGGILWGLGGTVYALQAYYVADARYAVVVVPRAELRNALGEKQKGSEAIALGAMLRIGEQRSNLVELKTQGGESWLLGSDVRLLQRNP